MIKLTKKQAKLFKARWQRIAEQEIRELRATPMLIKFEQLCFLMDSFNSGPSDKEREKQAIRVRKRWLALKRKLKNASR